MRSLGMILSRPDEIYSMLKMKMAVMKAKKQIPVESPWDFCYSTLNTVSKGFFLLIQQLGDEIRDAMCVCYLVLRALDTIEDDTSIPTEVKLPLLIDFHHRIYDCDWRFPCVTKECKVLIDQFHHVSSAFLELETGYQEAISDVTRRIGAGMAKFICQEVESIEDYDEYCHYAAGLVGLGLSKLFLASKLEVMTPDWEHLSNSTGLFLQKAHVIRDYLEDINEIPKSRMFWPREIWGKYVGKLEDLKDEKNSTKAVQCLNDMITNALMHIEDSFKYMAALRDPAVFRLCAIPQIMAVGALALCYDNVQVFRSGVKMRIGQSAKVMEGTKSMDDVYNAFYDFSCLLKTKVDKKDPNWKITLNRIETVQRVCRDNGVLRKRRLHMNEVVFSFGYVNDKARSQPFFIVMLVLLFLLAAIVFAYLKANRVEE